MKSYLPWVLLLIFGGVWLWSYTNHVKQIALLQSSADSLNHALGAQKAAQDARQDTIALLADSVTALQHRASQGRLRVDTLKLVSTSTDSAFAGRLADSLRAGFDSIRAVHQHIVAALEQIIAEDSVIQGDQAKQLMLRGMSLEECSKGLKVALEQRDKALRLAQPAFLTRLVKSAPAVAIGFLAAVILKR